MKKPKAINEPSLKTASSPKDLQPNKLTVKEPQTRARQIAPLAKVVIGSQPDVRKAQFAFNLDKLLELAGLSRKDAAEAMNLPHKFVLRVVKSGASRVDKRNEKAMATIAKYFELNEVEDLWMGNLIDWLLTAEGGKKFVKKFQRQLAEYRQRQIQTTTKVDAKELKLVGQALGVEEQSERPKMADYLKKAEMILSSRKSENLRRILDDYYDFISRQDRLDKEREDLQMILEDAEDLGNTLEKSAAQEMWMELTGRNQRQFFRRLKELPENLRMIYDGLPDGRSLK